MRYSPLLANKFHHRRQIMSEKNRIYGVIVIGSMNLYQKFRWFFQYFIYEKMSWNEITGTIFGCSSLHFMFLLLEKSCLTFYTNKIFGGEKKYIKIACLLHWFFRSKMFWRRFFEMRENTTKEKVMGFFGITISDQIGRMVVARVYSWSDMHSQYQLISSSLHSVWDQSLLFLANFFLAVLLSICVVTDNPEYAFIFSHHTWIY